MPQARHLGKTPVGEARITLRIKVDVHIHPSDAGETAATLKKILTRLTKLESTMADVSGAVTQLTDAIVAMQSRIEADVQNLRDLLGQALATETANTAEIARLNAEGDAAVASILGEVDRVASIDPDVNFPEPPVDPPV